MQKVYGTTMENPQVHHASWPTEQARVYVILPSYFFSTCPSYFLTNALTQKSSAASERAATTSGGGGRQGEWR